MQHLEVSGAVRALKWSLGVKWLRRNIKVGSVAVDWRNVLRLNIRDET